MAGNDSGAGESGALESAAPSYKGRDLGAGDGPLNAARSYAHRIGDSHTVDLLNASLAQGGSGQIGALDLTTDDQ